MVSYLLTRSLLDSIITSSKNTLHRKPSVSVKKEPLDTTPSTPAELMCRACAGSACTPLRDPLGAGDIMSALIAVSNLPINIEDKLPQYICNACLTQLEAALRFQQRCQATDRQLRSVLSPFSSSHSYQYSKHNFQQMLHHIKLKRAKELEKKEKKVKRQTAKKRLSEKKKKAKDDSFKCQPCSLTFTTKEDLSEHRKRQGCNRHPCHICGQLVSGLVQHVRCMHGVREAYTCHVCGKQFPIVGRLRSHQRVHSDTLGFHCAHCPYKSKHKYYLVQHMRTHTGEKPYRCEHCDAAFVNCSNYRKHRLTHSVKQIPCSQCDKSFRTPAAVRAHHAATHLQLTHPCRDCDRDFKYKADLRKHEIRYHNRIKKSYVGGEPTYKKIERKQQSQEGKQNGDSFKAVQNENSFKQAGSFTGNVNSFTENDRKCEPSSIDTVENDVFIREVKFLNETNADPPFTQIDNINTGNESYTQDAQTLNDEICDSQNGIQTANVCSLAVAEAPNHWSQRCDQTPRKRLPQPGCTDWVQSQPSLAQLLNQPARPPGGNLLPADLHPVHPSDDQTELSSRTEVSS